MLTLNEEDRLTMSLPKLDIFSEVIIFDSGSTDNTRCLCEKIGAKIYDVKWEGFGTTRRKLFEAATQPWILWLDADEVITDELSDELKALFSKELKYDAYEVNRMVFFEGSWIRHGEWFPDWNTRLFKNDVWKMDDRAVHESLEINGSIGKLNKLLEHHSFRNWEDYQNRQTIL